MGFMALDGTGLVLFVNLGFYCFIKICSKSNLKPLEVMIMSNLTILANLAILVSEVIYENNEVHCC